MYLPALGELSLDTPCLLLAYDRDADPADFDERGIPLAAISQGFPVEGLNRDLIEDTAEWARQFIDPPPDDLLLASYVYYLRFDAFLDSPDEEASPPPSAAERKDLAFYNALGPERNDIPCRREGCRRGAVAQSAYCRVHHYEMVMGEPCPFSE
jgi:hypothetical protein